MSARFGLPVLVMLALSACAGVDGVPPDPGLGPKNAAHVTIYRPAGDWMGAVVDYRAHAGRVLLGILARGGELGAFVKPGKTTIHVEAYFLGLAQGWPAKLDLDLRAGERRYIRFSQYLDSVVPLPTGPIATGGLQLRAVDEATYRKRE